MLAMPCLDLCVYVLLPCVMLRFAFVHVYVLGSMFYHVYVLSFHMFTHVLPYLCLDLCFHMLACLDLCLHMFMCSDLCSLHALCACTLHAMFVCLDLGYVCHAMCYCSPFVALSFLSCVLAYWFGPDLDPMVFVIVITPWPISKGLDHPSCMPVLACFYA